MNIGDVQPVNIEQQMRDAYLDYAMSVIVSRALPDARDGLKPVHRRILYAMHDMNLTAASGHKKSARIVGEVLGKYHPHGDAAVYEAMARLAQDFSMRYMLVDGQGNFGSIDGDSPAAMRYTEARMAELGEILLEDIDKSTVDFVENFDGSLTEPAVLPSSLPNMLINGASGIAVGMSTSIPPHNLGEVVDALIYMLGRWDEIETITVEDLMQFIQGPDFPTGGVIYSHKENDDENPSLQAYATGRGKITLRAKVHFEDMGRGKSRIIVSELPYQSNKTTLIERIASLVARGKLEGLADLRDESDRQNPVRLVIELQRGVDAAEILNDLFKLTPLQETFSIIMLALVDGQPRTLTLKQALRIFLDHRAEIIRRRSQYDLEKAQARAHILEGLRTALDNLDETIATIRRSRTVETARKNLMQLLNISETQAQAILDMQLRRLASLERKKIDEEYAQKQQEIAYLQDLLGDNQKVRAVIGDELRGLKEKYNDRRRTVIASGSATKVTESDLLMPQTPTWVMLTVDGKLGRTVTDEQPTVTTKLKNPPMQIHQTNTAQSLYLFTARGECATIPVSQLPQVTEAGEGTAFHELMPLPADTEITAAVCMPTMDAGYIFLTTRMAQVKRIRLSDVPGLSANSFTVMNVEGGDRLISALITDGTREIMLTTAAAQTIRFKEDDVRAMGLPAGGVRGVKLQNEDDFVVSALLADDNQYILNITDDGYGKYSACAEYSTQGRAGAGVITMRLPVESKRLAAATIGRMNDTLILLTNKNKPLYMRLSRAPEVTRGRKGGDIMISLRDNEEVISIVDYKPIIERIETPEEPATETTETAEES